MRSIAIVGLVALAVTCAAPSAARAADESKVKAATGQVEQGAKKIGDGKIAPGVEETAKGVGNTVVEGAKFTGEKLKESGKAAEPAAKSSWQSTKQGAVSFGTSVKRFFTKLFGG